MSEFGRLVLAATPLGNIDDASPRLSEALASADVIAAEDTRRLHRLTAALGVTPAGRVLSYYDANEVGRTPQLLEALRAGQTVVLVSDAGMPSISDPGYRLARAAATAGITVTVLPGPSAVTAALALSALPCDRFSFEGFLPRKAGERRRRLAGLKADVRTMVFFESPHRLADSLAALADEFGESRPAAVCRELSKTYEEVVRASLAELVEWAKAGVRGEITLVVAGAGTEPDANGESGEATELDARASEWIAQVSTVEQQGVPRKQAIAVVAALTGSPKRLVYNAVVGG